MGIISKMGIIIIHLAGSLHQGKSWDQGYIEEIWLTLISTMRVIFIHADKG